VNWDMTDENGKERTWGPFTVRVTLGDVIQVILLLAALVWFAAGYGSDIRSLQEWKASHEQQVAEFKTDYNEKLGQLQRQDVLEAKLDQINFRLDRIEKRLAIAD